MLEGVLPNTSSNMSTADLGGRRILGMSGSLTNYINTGKATPLDSFEKQNSETKTQKNKSLVKKVLAGAACVLGVAAGGYLLRDTKFVKSILNTKFITGIKDGFKGLIKKLKPKTTDSEDLFTKIKNKLPKKTKTKENTGFFKKFFKKKA